MFFFFVWTNYVYYWTGWDVEVRSSRIFGGGDIAENCDGAAKVEQVRRDFQNSQKSLILIRINFTLHTQVDGRRRRRSGFHSVGDL